MASQFDTWLRALRFRRDLSCDRGLPFTHTISYEGDLTTSGIAGTVKASPDATAELAVFTISSPVFADGFTTWTVSLSGAQTLALPADVDGDGRTDLVFDFLISGPGGVNPERLFGGVFTVVGFVTETA